MPAPLSNLTRLECSVCERSFAPTPRNVCECGNPLFARYRTGAVAAEELLPRGDLWRYEPMLPLSQGEHIVSLGEGGTPLLRCTRLERMYGLHRIYVKDESANPTGTFKARGLAVAVSKAKEFGLRRLAVPSAGNAGSALAAYAARAGLEALVVAPKDTPPTILEETLLYGAHLYLVDGTILTAGEIVRGVCESTDFFNVATLYEPYRVEGKKTMGYELLDELKRLPNWVVFPTGGGTGVIGLWKAFHELRDLGWHDGPPPRICAVQATGCAPIARAFEEGKSASEPWPNPATIAPGLRVPKAFADFLVLRALRETDGTSVAVSDDSMRNAVIELGSEGIGACYEGGATLAALRDLVDRGDVRPNDTVVLFNTGSPLKNPIPPSPVELETVSTADEVVRRLRRDAG